MKRALALLILLWSSTALAQYVTVRRATDLTTPCVAYSRAIVSTTGEWKSCAASGLSWSDDAIRACTVDPPVGACTGRPMCQGSTGLVYGCVSAAWAPIAASSAGASGTLQASNGSGGLSATTVTADSTTGALKSADSVRFQRVAEMYAHAALYGDPDYYTRPAVFDTWTDLFRGSPLRSTYDYDATSNPDQYGSSTEQYANIGALYAAACSGNTQYLCIDGIDTDADSSADTIDSDSDGTYEFKVGDVFFVTGRATTDVTTESPTLRSHIIKTLAEDPTNCGATRVRVQIGPMAACTAEGVTVGNKIHQGWRQAYHASFAMGYHMGYQLGYGSRLLHGAQGPNVLVNGSLEHNTAVENWTYTDLDADGTGAFASRAWQPNPATAGYNDLDCMEGGGTTDCLYMATDVSGDRMQSTAWIPVSLGERWVLSGMLAAQSASDIVGLIADTNNDGTLAVPTGLSYTVTTADSQLQLWGPLGWWWQTFTIPEGVQQVRAFVTDGATANRPGLDAFSLRRATTLLTDSFADATKYAYLINDPGTRNIIVTGHSWAADSGVYSLGYHICRGLEDALEARFGRNIDSQITCTGVSGYTSAQVLANFATLVTAYEPLYVIFVAGVNDVRTGVAEATTLNNYRQLAQTARSIGAIPIFMGEPPVAKDENADHAITSADFGAATMYALGHTLKDDQRATLLYWAP